MSSAMLDLGAQPVTLAQQIEELKRERRQRAAVYPRLIAAALFALAAACALAMERAR